MLSLNFSLFLAAAFLRRFQCSRMSRSPKFEKTGEVQFRIAKSSIRLLYDVIGNLDAMKKELVKSIGFGGILCFPPLRQMNRRFAVWLMSRVDPCSQTIVINESRRIKYSKEDVSRVFGLPCNGRSVFQNGMPRKEIVSKVTTGYLGIQAKGNRSIKAAQEVIERDYGRPMSQDEENAFKAAFVIYVASTLLAPGAKYDCPSVDYWNALADPSDIDKYDWADYVIRRLFDAVLKVKSDLKKGNVKAPSITGCSLFLQVRIWRRLSLSLSLLARSICVLQACACSCSVMYSCLTKYRVLKSFHNLM